MTNKHTGPCVKRAQGVGGAANLWNVALLDEGSLLDTMRPHVQKQQRVGGDLQTTEECGSC